MAENNLSIPFFLFDALRDYTEDFQIISRHNPYAFKMNGVLHSVHASQIHDSGEGRKDPDEWRIQLQGAVKRLQRQRAREGYKTNTLGFFPDGRVFSAWEMQRISALSDAGTGSVYIPFSDQQGVREHGAAMRTIDSRKLSRKSPEISLPISALGLYLENSAAFDAVRKTDDLIRILDSVASTVFAEQPTGSERNEVEIEGRRKKIVITRHVFARDPKFRMKVIAAYDSSCCICAKQLGLVEAAHIIPHGHKDSTESVNNGLALCAEHHRLYDSALLLPTAQKMLILNEERVEHLKNIGQDSGVADVRKLAVQGYRIPNDENAQPNENFLERGVKIRLGTDA